MLVSKFSYQQSDFDDRIEYKPIIYRDSELLEIFPEAKELIPVKIMEYEDERESIINNIHLFQQTVKEIATKEQKDEFFVWFWGYAYLKYFYAPRLVEIDRYLFRLKRQQSLINGEKHIYYDKLAEWENKKKIAANYPLVELAEPYLQKIRQSGNRLNALCPIHSEKTASFFIFINTNNFKCFGCGATGDSITFLMKMESLSFSEAVRRLSQ